MAENAEDGRWEKRDRDKGEGRDGQHGLNRRAGGLYVEQARRKIKTESGEIAFNGREAWERRSGCSWGGYRTGRSGQGISYSVFSSGKMHNIAETQLCKPGGAAAWRTTAERNRACVRGMRSVNRVNRRNWK